MAQHLVPGDCPVTYSSQLGRQIRTRWAPAPGNRAGVSRRRGRGAGGPNFSQEKDTGADAGHSTARQRVEEILRHRHE